MGDWPYNFDKNRYSVKECPCGKDNHDGKFRPFDGHEIYGRCYSCDKTFYPSGDAISDRLKRNPDKAKKLIPPVPLQLLKESMRDWDDNALVIYLRCLFPIETVSKLIGDYRIGTDSRRWKGATVLWYIDCHRAIQAGKIILYDSATGRRIKVPYPCVTWIHKVASSSIPEGYALRQCFFGEHLLSDTSRPVAIVEAERTAVVMAGKMPEFIWIAAGGKTGLMQSKFRALKGRDIILFPDSGKGYHEWKRISDDLRPHVRSIKVDETVHRFSKGESNLDLLDIIDIKKERKPKAKDIEVMPSENIEKDIPKDHIKKVRKLFPFLFGGDVLSHSELINAIVYNFRLTLPASDRIKPIMYDETQMAESMITDFLRSGAILKTDSGYYHAFDYSFPSIEIQGVRAKVKPHPVRWPIDELKIFFSGVTLPESVKLDSAAIITDVRKFIEAHLSTIERNNGNPIYQRYFDRLLILKSIISGS